MGRRPRARALLRAVAGVFTNREERMRRSLLDVPLVSASDARDGALVRVAGRVAKGQNGATVAPFSGTPAVWFRARYEALHRNDDTNDLTAALGVLDHRHRPAEWVTEILAESGVAFFVDDGSGVLAEVDASAARVLATERRLVDTSWLDREPPPFQAFMHAHGKTTSLFMGSDLENRFLEAGLRVGDGVTVAGVARRVPGAPRLDGYRSASSVRLVLSDAVVALEPPP